MGNLNSSDYTQYKEILDTRFGNIKIWRKQNNLFMEKSHYFNNEHEMNDYLNQCQLLKSLDHPSLLKLYDYKMQVNCYFQNCSQSNNWVTIYMEYYETDLYKEVNQRNLSQEWFSEEELRYIMENLLSVCNYLQEYAIYHGDLTTQNILITSTGMVKIGDTGIITPFKSGPLKTIDFKKNSYPSPELLAALKVHNPRPSIDYFKSDLFTLGMTFIELAMLTSLNSCYGKLTIKLYLLDWNSVQINWGLLGEFIKNLKSRYTSQIQETIKKMLSQNPSTRCEFRNALKMIAYQNQIYQRPFKEPLRQPSPIKKKQMISFPQQQNFQKQFLQAQLIQQPLIIPQFQRPQIVVNARIPPIQMTMGYFTPTQRNPITIRPLSQQRINPIIIQNYQQQNQKPRAISEKRNSKITIKSPSEYLSDKRSYDSLEDKINNQIKKNQQTIVKSLDLSYK